MLFPRIGFVYTYYVHLAVALPLIFISCCTFPGPVTSSSPQCPMASHKSQALFLAWPGLPRHTTPRLLAPLRLGSLGSRVPGTIKFFAFITGSIIYFIRLYLPLTSACPLLPLFAPIYGGHFGERCVFEILVYCESHKYFKSKFRLHRSRSI